MYAKQQIPLVLLPYAHTVGAALIKPLDQGRTKGTGHASYGGAVGYAAQSNQNSNRIAHHSGASHPRSYGYFRNHL
jgi:hypothetical protein